MTRKISNGACVLGAFVLYACAQPRQPAHDNANANANAAKVSATPTTTTSIAIADAAVPLVASADASTSETDAGAPPASGGEWPYTALPSIENIGGYAGYTKDDRYLGYQISNCGNCPEEFHFVAPGLPEITFATFSDWGGEQAATERRQAAHDAAVMRRIATLGVQKVSDGRKLRGPFPYADLMFAMKTTSDAATGKTSLHFGARVGKDEPVYPMQITLGPHPLLPKEIAEAKKTVPAAEQPAEIKRITEGMMMSEPTLMYANVSKNGTEIAIVAHARGPYWHETAAVLRMPVAKFVKEVYAGSKTLK